MLNNTQQKYKMVHIKETCKVAEISDAFNKLRYKVEMTSYDVIDSGIQKLAYQIQVINYFYGPEPILVYERPAIDEPLITDSKVACAIFDECVRNYTSLVKAETRPYKDIDIFREKIGYKETCPACCMTCKWHKVYLTPNNYIHSVTNTCYCTNPQNCEEYEFDIKRSSIDEIRRKEHENTHGHKIRHDDCSHNVIYPKVTLLGVCDNYSSLDRTNMTDINQPGENLIDVINQRVDVKLQSERLLSV